MNKLLFSILLLLYAVNVRSQDAYKRIQAPLPPQAAAFQTFFTSPATSSNGIPDVSINLYTVRCGEVEVPITLRYHPNNLVVNESVLSNVAMGWVLDAGGVLTRKVNNKPDEGFEMADDQEVCSLFPDVENEDYIFANFNVASAVLAQNPKDIGYDKFTYGLPNGKSGSFLLVGKKDGVFLSGEPFKVENVAIRDVFPLNVRRVIDGIAIKDDVGVEYTYGFNNSMGWTDIGNPFGSIVSAWQLSGVKNHLNDSVSFYYNEPQVVLKNFLHPYYLRTDKKEVLNSGERLSYLPGNQELFNEAELSMTYSSLEVKFDKDTPLYSHMGLLSKIAFRGGFVEIVSNDKVLVDEIRVYSDAFSKPIKRVVFEKSRFRIFGSDSFSEKFFQKLAAVKIYDASNILQEEYQFSYNDKFGGDVNSYTCDVWGFLNGQSSSKLPDLTLPCVESRLPQEVIKSVTNYSTGGSRYANEDYGTNFTLTEMITPHKGRIRYKFELNRYSIVEDKILSSESVGGGMRIGELSFEDGVGNETKTKYTYLGGKISTDIDKDENRFVEQYYFDCWFNDYKHGDVFYPILFQDFGGAFPFTVMRQTRISKGWNSFVGLDGNLVSYSEVKEENFDINNEKIGGVKSTYTYPEPYTYASQSGAPFLKKTLLKDQSWMKSILKERVTFDKFDRVVKKTNFTYQHFQNSFIRSSDIFVVKDYSSIEKGLFICAHSRNGYAIFRPYTDENFRGYNFVRGVNSLPNQNMIGFITLKYPFSLYDFYHYSFSVGKQVLIEEAVTEFVDNGSVVSRTTYEYANGYLKYPTAVKLVNSNGDEHSTKYKYPYDNSSIPNNVLCQKNILNVVLDESKAVNGHLLSSTTNTYDLYNGIPLVRSIDKRFSNGEVKNLLTVLRYDRNGNILKYIDSKKIKTSLLYDGYNNIRGVCANDAIDGINTAVTSSFENRIVDANMSNMTIADGFELLSGVWSYSSNAKTGSRSIGVGVEGGIISTQEALPKGRYRACYFGRRNDLTQSGFIRSNVSPLVIGSSEQAMTSTDGVWKYVSVEFYLEQEQKISLQLGNALIDEIQIYPIGSKMKTFAHIPGVGVCTSVNEQGEIFNFMYDSYGRLSMILDGNEKVVKQFQYNIAK